MMKNQEWFSEKVTVVLITAISCIYPCVTGTLIKLKRPVDGGSHFVPPILQFNIGELDVNLQ